MVILYFLGGEDLLQRDSREINRKAFIHAGGQPTVLIFPWTSASEDKANKYRRIMLDYFLEIGAREIEFAEISDSFNEISEKMGRSDLVYLPGGDTRLLIQRMKNAKIGGLLNEYRKVIIGNSAGALVLCKECILSVDEKDPEAKVTAGLGLVDFSVYVHYNSSIDGELKKLSKDRKIYAIPEKSALLCDHGDLSFLGSICLFNGSKKRSVGGHLDGTD